MTAMLKTDWDLAGCIGSYGFTLVSVGGGITGFLAKNNLYNTGNVVISIITMVIASI